MSHWLKRGVVVAFAGLLLAAGTGRAEAQFRYGYGGFGGFSPFIGYGPYANGDPYGGYLQGTASVVNATGQFAINSQKAFLLKEQVRSAQMDNRRRAYDEWLYERATMPTLNDERKRIQEEELRRARSMPPDTEIWSGKSLNDLFANIRQAQARGYIGPDIPLNQDVLRQINVTTTSQGNVGLLKDAGNLSWPIGLQVLPPEDQTTALRKQIDTLFLAARDQVASGSLNARTITDLSANIGRLRTLLVANVGEMSFTDYTASRRFLGSLDEAVTVLKAPDASKYVNGRYAARGATVKELVQYMTENGLTFAAAIRGEEAAYNSLYNSLLSYDIQTTSLMASPGSQSEIPPGK